MAGQQSDVNGWRVRVISPADLQAGDIAAWNALRAAHKDYDSPLLSPDFAQVSGEGRPDAKIGLIEDAQGLAAVLAVYARPDGLGRPIGSPFCDYSGPVVRQDMTLSLAQIAGLMGLGGYRTHSLLDPWDRFVSERTGGTISQLVRVSGEEADRYLEQRRAEYPKRFKNFRRLASLMAREGHESHLEWGPFTPALRDKLYAFKSLQYRASGLVDLIHAPRARALLDAVERSQFGFQASLWAGDELISADFGFREGEAFHPWIAAYNPAFAVYSPGNLLQKRVIKQIGAIGLTAYDLAEGHDHYKKYFTNCGRKIYSVDVTVPGWRGALLSAQRALWSLSGAKTEGSATSRLKRRLDLAAVSYTRTGDVVADLVTALRKRGVSATPAQGRVSEAD